MCKIIRIICIIRVMIKLYSEQKKKQTLWPLFMDGRFKCLKASEPTTRRQFTFYHWVPRNSWYSFKRARKGERLSWPWTYPVVFNTGPLDWESSALTTRQLLHMKQDSISFILIFDKVFHYIMLTCTQKLTEVIQILQSIFLCICKSFVLLRGYKRQKQSSRCVL